jgi:hypothetical protein
MTSLKSFDEHGAQHAWDATSLSSYSKCGYYYYLKHIQGWQPDLKSVHLVFGGHYAHALESFAKLRAQGESYDDATFIIVSHLLDATWDYEKDDNGQRIPGTGVPQDWMDANKSRETLIRSVVWYLEHFKDDNAETVILSDGTPAVEYSFALPLDDGITYCGHIDKLVTFSDDYFVMDQKTSKQTITPRYFDQFSPDWQMSGYSFAGKILFDLPITGVIIDAAQIAVGFTQFSRGFVHKSAPVLEDWYEHMMRTVTQARRDTIENSFRMNPASCGNYGGCEFRKVCSRAPEHRRGALEANFTQRPRWDPLVQR